jgi:hypothetical protein
VAVANDPITTRESAASRSGAVQGWILPQTRDRVCLLKEIPAVSQDINVLALVKGAERYVFLYDDQSRAETLRVLGRFASNPELSFTWYDAAVLSQKIRQEGRKAAVGRRFSLPLPSDKDEPF